MSRCVDGRVRLGCRLVRRTTDPGVGPPGDRVTPYYEDDFATIYHDRCEDVLPRLSDVDLILTSPPYNLAQTHGTVWTALKGGYGEHDDAMPHDLYVTWQRRVLSLCWSTLSDRGAIYYQHKPRVLNKSVLLPFELNPDLPLRQVVTWDRGSGFMRQFTCYVPRYEWILIFARDAFRITTRDVDDLWRIPPETGTEHPAPFPLALASRAINTTPPGLVVDPFMGSGTTLRAAKDAGRRCIGIERNERFCEIAARRLSQEVLDFGAAS